MIPRPIGSRVHPGSLVRASSGGAPDHVDDRQHVAGRAPVDPVQHPGLQDAVPEQHPGDVDDRGQRERQHAHPDRLAAVAASVAKGVQEPDQQDDERGAQPGSREHREGLQLGRGPPDVQAQGDRRDRRSRQHDVRAEPPRPERGDGVAEQRAVAQRRRERLGALLHELDRQNEQEQGDGERGDLEHEAERAPALGPPPTFGAARGCLRSGAHARVSHGWHPKLGRS